ncbi:hypothetical protein PsYK624_083980 [Phanerochaete sordida]|uniref:Uncharacterized protein n=1 Tax=Phanerochaete sordida TaxID=48140 RepID=A0A9P3LEH1_9APHY|nr:hypothetical protein PsYK624_083980 [Phanerochaete sordida]
MPDTPAEAPAPQKSSGPFVVDSTGPSRPASPAQTPAPQSAEKAKKKKKAEPAPSANPEASATEASSKKNKRRAGDVDDETDQPLAKKAKKKSQVDKSAPAAPTSPPAAPAASAEASAKGKKKKTKDSQATHGDQPEQVANGVAEAAPAPAKASQKKKLTSTDAAPVAAAVANGEVTEKPKKRKTKAQKAAEDAAAADATIGIEPAQGLKGESSKKAEGPAVPEPKAKASRKGKKEKEKPTQAEVAAVDDDIFAAISAVLGKTKANGVALPNHVDPAPAPKVPEPAKSTASAAPKKSAAKATSAARKAPAKSRLSTSWGPADLEDEAIPDGKQDETPAADPDDSSISVAISRAHERASAAVAKAPNAPASSSSVNGKAPGETSASHVSAAPEPTRRLSGVISAGSQFSEVPIQGHDEGSSDDSDEENDEQEVEAVAIPPLSASASRLNSASNSANLSEMDVEALLRGPLPRKSILSLLPSDSSEEDKSESEDEELASEAEEKEEKAYRRMSKRFEKRAPASSDEELVDDDEAAASGMEEPAATASPEVEESAAEDGDNSVESPAPVAVAESNSGLPLSSTADVKLVSEENASEDETQLELQDDVETTPLAPAAELKEEEYDVVPTSDPVEAAEVEKTTDEQPVADDFAEEVQPEEEDIEEPALEIPQSSQTVPESELAADDDADTAGLQQEEAPPAHTGSTPADSPGERPSQEDEEDPIEPSEDFDKQPSIEIEDPIEMDEEDVLEKATPPPVTPPKSGQTKRMRDRNGKLPSSNAPPASQPVRRSTRASSRQPEAPSKRAETAPPASVPEEEELSQQGTEVRRSSRKTTQEPSTEPAPPSPVPAAEPPVAKRRGRPPTKSAEEKAKIAADKEAEKKRKAEEREAEKQRKAAERKAAAEEKARLKAEKAAAAKEKKASAGKKSNAADEKAEEAEVDEAEPPSTQTTRPAASQPVRAPAKAPLSPAGISTAQWTALSQASSMHDADTISMVDELRSSSPSHGSEARSTAVQDEERDDADAEDHDVAHDSEDDTPTVKVPPRALTQPLFTPSDSQSQSQGQHATPQHSSQPAPGGSQPASQSPFKRPIPTFKPQFRRLSDIASQDMFSPRSPVSSVPLPSQRRQSSATVEDRRASMYGDLAHASDSSSDDDDDDEPISHIPKNRRAGVQKKEMFAE